MRIKSEGILRILVVIVFILIVIFSVTDIWWYLKPSKTIKLETTNINNNAFFENHYNTVLKKLKISDSTNQPIVVKDFKVIVSVDGEIEDFRYKMFYFKNYKPYRASIKYSSLRKCMTSKKQKITKFRYWYDMVGMNDYMKTLDTISYRSLLELLPAKDGTHNYCIDYLGEYTFDANDAKKDTAYIWQDNELVLTHGQPSVIKETMKISALDKDKQTLTSVLALFDAFSRHSGFNRP